MTWQPELDELKRRQELAAQLGGERGIAEQRRRGKLTAPERIAGLADPGSFREFGGLVGSATYDQQTSELLDFLPKGSINGNVSIDAVVLL